MAEYEGLLMNEHGQLVRQQELQTMGGQAASAAPIPAQQPAEHLVHGHMLHNYRDPDTGDRLVGWPTLGWVLGLLGVALGVTILVLTALHYRHSRSDGKQLDNIEGLLEALNVTCTTCPACNPTLNVTINNVTSDCANDTANVIYCDLVIGGAGPAGVYAAYRLGPHFTVCLIDSRDRIGGKVYTYDSNVAPGLSSPTHAEQLAMSHTIGRCWYQELGIHSWIRGTVGSYFEGFTRNRNWTAPVCNDATMPPVNPPACNWGNSYERVAPNGDLDPATFYQMDNPCGADPWLDCSYEDQYYSALSSFAPSNDETYQQYVINSLGQEEFAYLRASAAQEDLWDYPHSAKYIVDYDNFEASQGFSALVVPDGGPYRALEAGLVHALGNGTQLYLGERVTEIKDVATSDAVYNMEVVTTLHRFRAKRVVFAAPPYFAKELGGDMGGSIANDPHVTFGMHTEACTWNGFFESKWWAPSRTQCIDGFCAFVDDFIITDFQRGGITWSFIDTSESSPVEFIQYLPTPERNESNLLRVFIKPSYCKVINEILENTGQQGVSDYVSLYLHSRFDGNGTLVSGILDGHFSNEPSSYSGLRVGVTFDYAEQADWAKRPFPGRRLCMASEGFSTEYAGWMEGALRSVHRCFREQYLDTFTEEEIRSWETCCNPQTESYAPCGSACASTTSSSPSPGPSFCIDDQDPDTWSYCNRLSGEDSLRDYYDYCYCEACTAGASATGEPETTPHPNFVPDLTERPMKRSGRYIVE